MEPSSGSSSSLHTHRPNVTHPPRTTSASSTLAHSSNNRTVGDPLRRGHSDGDMLLGGHNGRSGVSTEPASAERETWIDFIRQTPSAIQDPLNRAQMAANKAAIMASDRRKRLAEHHEDYTRRRSSSTLSYMHPGGDRSRHSFTQASNERPSFGPTNTSNSPPMQATQGSRERPLPPPPSIETLQNRRSREITLPRWQPDAEVSSCPICGTAFNMFYRRHHCRKCGRVVCANCSPHRITIPRQFIVHPPEDATPSPTMATNPGIQIVDLTGDGHGTERASSSDRPQSSDYRIDPALGGGQEVRLCNPCVPDPNPLPHLPYPSPHTLPGLHHAPRPDAMSSHHRSSVPRNDRSDNAQTPTLTRRISSGPSEYRPHDATRFDASLASNTSRATNRRHSHAPHPVEPSMSPPGYSSLYGSAPDRIAHQRHMQALMQSQTSHRHHASMGSIPSSSTYRPMPSFDAPMSRPVPQPQLREEDTCPVCHHALPPKESDGSEVAREAHINSCIERVFSSSGPGTSHAPPSTPAEAASAATLNQGSGARPIPPGHRDSAGSNDMPSGSFQQRRAGMVVFPASEKDCVNKDGEVQECVICFEDFAVGDELGRLECWCKFHKACIRRWWDSGTKGPGSCPVHQHGA